ncbi:MAG: glycosyltransferase family 39 protein [Nitrospirae bacterium]|nr:glycosyltransferase family 39 protein [Nitrospirota bacterium]
MSVIPAIIPLLCFIAIFLVIYRMPDRLDWRSSFILASIVCGVLLVIFTEILSLFHALVYEWVIGLWTLACIAALIILITNRRYPARQFKSSWSSRIPYVWLFGVIFIVSVTGLIALASPPNNWDSMTYHMSRVAHWIQNQSVSFYPTPIPRQLYLSPWAEFAVTHLQILSSGDWFANLVQWFSMIGSIIGVTLIVQQLGGDMRSQILAAVITVTIPMGILQASGTQNDYVISFWLVSFVCCTMQLRGGQAGSIWSAGAACSLGLALLTKGTAYLYTFPFLVWLICSGFQRFRWKAWKSISFMIVIAVILNLGHYSRNLDLYGSPLGPGAEGAYGELKFVNEAYTLPALISNITRNVGLHMSTPVERLNSAVEGGIARLHTLMGMEINDARTTLAGTKFHIPPLAPLEDFSGNPVHLLIVWIAIALLFIKRDLLRRRILLYYFAAVSSAFLLFSLCLKWQPWHSRLHLPLFVLLSAFVAVVLSDVLSARLAEVTGIILILSALPWIFFNVSRPVIAPGHIVSMFPSWIYGSRPIPLTEGRSILTSDRTDQYFSIRRNLGTPYREAAAFVRSQKCRDIGLYMGGDDWEYPFWALLQADHGQKTRIEHIGVKNISAVKSSAGASFTPCAIISVNAVPGERHIHGGNVYTLAWSMEPVSVFIR